MCCHVMIDGKVACQSRLGQGDMDRPAPEVDHLGPELLWALDDELSRAGRPDMHIK